MIFMMHGFIRCSCIHHFIWFPRTPAPEPPPKAVTAAAPPSLPAPEAPAASEAKLRGRRGSRNLLAELAGDGDRELRWEPVTATRLTAFEPPTRKLGVAWFWKTNWLRHVG